MGGNLQPPLWSLSLESISSSGTKGWMSGSPSLTVCHGRHCPGPHLRPRADDTLPVTSRLRHDPARDVTARGSRGRPSSSLPGRGRALSPGDVRVTPPCADGDAADGSRLGSGGGGGGGR